MIQTDSETWRDVVGHATGAIARLKDRLAQNITDEETRNLRAEFRVWSSVLSLPERQKAKEAMTTTEETFKAYD